ncbi:MAG: ABC transporter substrate-binding protein [Chloroflexi bacterium]|nr:MAG: ABC transporter substrate-binding protein [Chloroflexota bacterium]
MSQYIVRRVLTAIPTLLLISFVIFALLDLAPGDPTSNLPLSIPQEVREKIRDALGMDQPFLVRYGKWMQQFFINEPLNALEALTGVSIGNSADRLRITSWTSRGKPVIDLIIERIPQTLWVVGLSYLFAVLIAVPLGVVAAVRQNSVFDQISTVLSVIGFSMPTFFTGLLAIVIFSVNLKWFPSVYNTTLEVKDWPSLVAQIKQMVLPVAVLTFFQTATLSRFTRASMLDNLALDYVRTARAKGLQERLVVVRHVLRNSLIPVATLIALGVPQIFAGAIITEQIFRINGLGALLINSIQSFDIPVVMTTTVIFAILVVIFNLLADILYAVLDPRIQY